MLTLIPHIQPKEKQTLSFTDDLPAEVRLLVYGHLFKTPGNYFELWAATHLVNTGTRFKNVFDLYLKNKKALGILRLSKKVHAEAAEFFYGRNNFRFSDYDGLAVMAVFHHTIGQANCDLVRHVTVQVPNSNRSLPYWRGCIDRYTKNIRQVSDAGWLCFEGIHRGRGMRVPNFGYSRRHVCEGLIRGRFNFDKAVARGYRQLQNMASLRTLEILIPWDYRFITGMSETRWSETRWSLFDNMMSEEPYDAITMRNLVRSFSFDPECWALLEQLKEESASADLTISLILIQNQRWEASHNNNRDYDVLRQHRYLAEYAKVMGYRFGHATWEEDNSTYVVQYDKD